MKALLLLFAVLLATAAPAEQARSAGYAGSTPVGLDGLVAIATLDCDAINVDPHRGRLRTPFVDDCRLQLPSPDGRWIARTEQDRTGDSRLSVSGTAVVRGLSQPTVFLWNPDSSGFLLNGGEGSGQVSHVRYFFRNGAQWRRSTRLANAASRLYRERFDCRGGRKSYTNTSGWAWTRTGLLRVIVQEGVHSAGCLQPHTDRNVLFEVMGDPVSGRVVSAREIDSLP